jgi:vacuolar-type H+-ATPase subunit E/Vma4
MGAGCIVVYDLISENWGVLKNTEHVHKLRAARIRATELLHRLGVLCTESVILVRDGRRDEVNRVINEVRETYDAVLSEIERALGVAFPRPIIRILELTPQQYATFTELAERRLREALDANIDRVSSLSERLEDVRGSANVKNLLTSLRKLRREWIKIRENVVALGIPLSDDIDYLIQLIDDVMANIRGG